MGHAVRVVLIIPCVAIVFGFAAFGGGAAQAQSTNAAGAEFDGLCRQRGGVPSGNQCLIAPSAPAPSAPRSSGGGGQNFNRAMGNFNNALGALGAEQEQEEQDRENAAEQQRQDQAARDAAEAQRRAAEAVADAQRRAGLSNPFGGSQQASAPGNPFVSTGASLAPIQAAAANPFLSSGASSAPSATPIPSKASAADITTQIGTPKGCAAAGGTWEPANANVAIPGCGFPVGGNRAPAPAPVQASNLCDALRQTYQGYLAAAAQDVGVQSAVDLDQQGANSILDAYNRGNCAKGGASATGGTALRDQVRQQLANRSLGAQMNAVNPNGFGQSYVPVTAPGGTTENKLQDSNNAVSSMNAALGFLAGQQGGNEANLQVGQQQGSTPDDHFVQPGSQQVVQPGNQQVTSNQPAADSNPFAPGGAGNPLGAPMTAAGPQSGPNGPQPAPDQNSRNDPAEPDRKLGEPSQADSLPFLTRSGCEADHGGIIALPGGAKPYCVIEVDNPEPTNEWHYMIEDAAPAKKPQIKSPGVAVMGVRD